VSAAAAGEQRHFAGDRRIGAGDIDRVLVQRQFRMRLRQADKLFSQEIFPPG